MHEIRNFGLPYYSTMITEYSAYLNVECANKVLFISNSIGVDNYDFHLKELPKDIETTSQYEFSDTVHIKNLIGESALLNVKKGFIKRNNSEFIDDTIKYVNTFFFHD
ncbi:hypothetical protein C6P45_002221 [Maudiozyma exigua]|uniref:Uncharacterized protein n=1 Tax=Maudiozyma exigua TaxID=34358 RepID=A0A9P7B4L3_MAUEX|nr:hypothetical protein C6P45_002221 [Kazachstania exigua]